MKSIDKYSLEQNIKGDPDRIGNFPMDKNFKLKALCWASGFDDCIFLNYSESTLFYSGHPPFPSILGAGSLSSISEKQSENSFERLKSFLNKEKKPAFGYFGYDLKNSIEKLESRNSDQAEFPDLHFFIPEHLITFRNNIAEIKSPDPEKIFNEINVIDEKKYLPGTTVSRITLQERISKEDYLKKVEKIKNHLLEGDIYELNLCQEFFATEVILGPVQVFLSLSTISPAPFSVFLKNNDKYLISASPERFLMKKENKLISQPIKGTAMRVADPLADEKIKSELSNSEKERSENMMIVDLVRNDLAKSSVPGTVKVEEMFGIYSFPQVHQMISTISSTIKDNIHPVDAIKNAFPMGSMTGAPKIRAMQLIEEYEESKRGLFSGAAGYLKPDGDFDLNVVIRSLIYNSSTKYLSFQAGSAITFDSDPEKEYEECLLKGKAIREALGRVSRS